MSQFYYNQYQRSAQPASRSSSVYRPGAYGVFATYAPAAAVDPLAQAYATLWLRPGAPVEVVRATYRALAQKYHPDAGGDPELMRRINQAYTILQGALGQEA